jgi:hypothetical protein
MMLMMLMMLMMMLLLQLLLCWQRHMVYICSSNTTVQLYVRPVYRECLGIPSQCFFMPKKCPKKTSLPMPVSTVSDCGCACSMAESQR